MANPTKTPQASPSAASSGDLGDNLEASRLIDTYRESRRVLNEYKFLYDLKEQFAKPANVQEIVAKQIELLANFYVLTIEQAKKSFRWALVAAGIGLLFFLASVAIMLYYHSQELARVSLISGALVEVISAINFYLYSKTSAQLSEFHTRLESTQRFLLANSMCETLEGSSKQECIFNIIKALVETKSVHMLIEPERRKDSR